MPKNMSFEKNVSSVLDVSNTGDCLDCDLDDCDVGLNTASTFSFIVLSLICGIRQQLEGMRPFLWLSTEQRHFEAKQITITLFRLLLLTSS